MYSTTISRHDARRSSSLAFAFAPLAFAVSSRARSRPLALASVPLAARALFGVRAASPPPSRAPALALDPPPRALAASLAPHRAARRCLRRCDAPIARERPRHRPPRVARRRTTRPRRSPRARRARARVPRPRARSPRRRVPSRQSTRVRAVCRSEATSNTIYFFPSSADRRHRATNRATGRDTPRRPGAARRSISIDGNRAGTFARASSRVVERGGRAARRDGGRGAIIGPGWWRSVDT